MLSIGLYFLDKMPDVITSISSVTENLATKKQCYRTFVSVNLGCGQKIVASEDGNGGINIDRRDILSLVHKLHNRSLFFLHFTGKRLKPTYEDSRNS